MLKLRGWGLRPWIDFELDPSSGNYVKRRLKAEPEELDGYAGYAQELRVAGLGTVLCSMFLHRGEISLHVGSAAWNLFEPGLQISHRDGFFRCELSIREAGGKETLFRYRRKDTLLVMLDSTYDDQDMELANLPAMFPHWIARDKAEFIGEWSRSQ